jgi:hypothetical protein
MVVVEQQQADKIEKSWGDDGFREETKDSVLYE